MYTAIRRITMELGRIHHCLRTRNSWILLSIVILSLDVVHGASSFTVDVSSKPMVATPGTIITLTCKYSLPTSNVSLLYWVDGKGRNLYGFYPQRLNTAPEVGPDFLGKIFDINTQVENQHSFKLNSTACDTSKYKCSVWDSSSTENTSSVMVKVEDIKRPEVQCITKNKDNITDLDKCKEENADELKFKCVINDASMEHTLNLTIFVNSTQVFHKVASSKHDVRRCSFSSSIVSHKIRIADADIKPQCVVVYKDGLVLESQIPEMTTDYTATSTSNSTEPVVGASSQVWQEPWVIVCIAIAAVILIVVIVIIIVLLLKKNKVICTPEPTPEPAMEGDPNEVKDTSVKAEPQIIAEMITGDAPPPYQKPKKSKKKKRKDKDKEKESEKKDETHDRGGRSARRNESWSNEKIESEIVAPSNQRNAERPQYDDEMLKVTPVSPDYGIYPRHSDTGGSTMTSLGRVQSMTEPARRDTYRVSRGQMLPPIEPKSQGKYSPTTYSYR